MEQQTKTILSQEDIRSILAQNLKIMRKTVVFECIMYAVFYIPCVVFLDCMALMWLVRWIAIPLVVLLMPVFCIPIVRLLREIRNYLDSRMRYRQGDIAIVTASVAYKTEHHDSRNGTRYDLHFDGYERVSVGKTQYHRASRGDTYILVHYKGHEDIQLFFRTELYELQG